jgi:predicted anti-sigma-YlaC factor YlaD
MYLRGRDYCLRSLEVGYPGIAQRLHDDPQKAVAVLQKKDVPAMYWTSASWGKAVSISLDRPALAGDFPIVQALIRRALALDEAYHAGAIHEVMITIESLPAEMGGDPARARQHYARALTLSQGNSAGAHVSYATGVLLPEQNEQGFVGLLNKALAVDVDREPRLRLANLLAQQYARYLLDHLDALFLSEEGDRKP